MHCSEYQKPPWTPSEDLFQPEVSTRYFAEDDAAWRSEKVFPKGYF